MQLRSAILFAKDMRMTAFYGNVFQIVERAG